MAFGDPKPTGLESILPTKGPAENLDATYQFANLEASHGVGSALALETLSMFRAINAVLVAAGRLGFSKP
jgi:hypothetical protein